ncbi:orf128 [Sucra jujuba nucleopolyhedrovirus]|uniref:Orf128 n=1 Tax=Sucra jujuba nucleopolyhedrovirus TaxID=1563660 RepID=A0A097P960_9ABAC|nr:orf128 [Sucra jujuba nucleopolyhedrovirus]AIU41367.1 orf128 [Sucra jujuba nucleopolyhedrovirus]
MTTLKDLVCEALYLADIYDQFKMYTKAIECYKLAIYFLNKYEESVCFKASLEEFCRTQLVKIQDKKLLDRFKLKKVVSV